MSAAILRRIHPLFMIMCAISILFLLARSAHAIELTTRIDGYWWNKTAELADPTIRNLVKSTMLAGIYQGVFTFCPEKGEQQLIRAAMGNLASALDQFYSDYRNCRIPVSLALGVVALELKGTPKDKAHEGLRALRALFSK